jgi:hypothetical protein
MRVLVACEFSGVVREAFRARGHDAWSCDLLPATDGSQFHLQGEVRQWLDGYGPSAEDGGWDLMIAHPPCTHLAVSGARYFSQKVQQQQDALQFVHELMNAPIPKICIENPVGVISSKIRKPDQIIQPYQFGHPESKKTCLWLTNLPQLVYTNVLTKPEGTVWQNQTPSGQNKLGPSADRWALRSVTYAGIAQAMASQWG